eukprot:CAMPEP_0181447800 /NCGR_PEP_ID=MMETSP1110-20121109/26809_1 /TAXON_ID=174948 /ORGANISM="Symbiodinium sp., Strain CCMP421" /LENGTH=228 /DNA_ID=CAMNT_0023571925 /DNA_START=53 /DNA_END=739 /DNA_ORIENTATION=+
MGAGTSSLFQRPRSSSVLVVGLDCAGKTTMVYSLSKQVKFSMPTLGFTVEEVDVKTRMNLVNVTAYDVGGRENLRPLYRHFYTKTDAMIFVVDCNDRDRVNEVELQLRRILQEDDLIGKPLLVFANKQDLRGAMSGRELVGKLGLHGIRDRKWFVQESTMTTTEGLYEGLEWLLSTLHAPPRRLREANLQDRREAVLKAKDEGAEEVDDVSTADTESAYRDESPLKAT